MRNDKENIIVKLSLEFAVMIVTYAELLESKKKYVVANQILKSGTSIGANAREARNAESKTDFIHKMGVAQKECDETLYWLELLYATNYINEIEYNSLHSESLTLLKIIKSIIITTKQNLQKKQPITHNS